MANEPAPIIIRLDTWDKVDAWLERLGRNTSNTPTDLVDAAKEMGYVQPANDAGAA